MSLHCSSVGRMVLVMPMQSRRYANQRSKVAAPMVPLAVLRKSSGKTLQDVCDYINREYSLPKKVERGTISAIENGHRGASVQMLAAIADALGISSDSIDTKYEPRQSRAGQGSA